MRDKINDIVQVRVEKTVEEADFPGEVYRLKFGLRVSIFLACRGRLPDRGAIKEHWSLLQFCNS